MWVVYSGLNLTCARACGIFVAYLQVSIIADITRRLPQRSRWHFLMTSSLFALKSPGFTRLNFSAPQTSCGLSRGVTGRYPASAWPCPPNHSCLLSLLFFVVAVSMRFSFSTLTPLALALVARVAAQSTGTDCARTCFPPVLQIDAAEGPSKCISDGVSAIIIIRYWLGAHSRHR